MDFFELSLKSIPTIPNVKAKEPLEGPQLLQGTWKRTQSAGIPYALTP